MFGWERQTRNVINAKYVYNIFLNIFNKFIQQKLCAHPILVIVCLFSPPLRLNDNNNGNQSKSLHLNKDFLLSSSSFMDIDWFDVKIVHLMQVLSCTSAIAAAMIAYNQESRSQLIVCQFHWIRINQLFKTVENALHPTLKFWSKASSKT